mmetsp:Transcript_19730/g.50500  ORF Transcript_19730/g.50500 Transcript_19730/m.50500 type:complete len:365 (-) Transcript_19730:90-1184(-)
MREEEGNRRREGEGKEKGGEERGEEGSGEGGEDGEGGGKGQKRKAGEAGSVDASSGGGLKRAKSIVRTRSQRARVVTSTNVFEPLNSFHRSQGKGEIKEWEMSPKQAEWILNLIKDNKHVKSMIEIGFGSAHMGVTLLAPRSDTSLISFGQARSAYVKDAKVFLDQEYPNRHIVIEGDPVEQFKRFVRHFPAMKFDLAVILAHATIETTAAYLSMLESVAHKNTLIIMDNIDMHKITSENAFRAWHSATESGLVYETEFLTFKERVWALGKFGLGEGPKPLTTRPKPDFEQLDTNKKLYRYTEKLEKHCKSAAEAMRIWQDAKQHVRPDRWMYKSYLKKLAREKHTFQDEIIAVEKEMFERFPP